MEPALDIRSGMDAEVVAPPSGTGEDVVRANTYGLLGALLAGPPRQEFFDLLASIEIPSADGLGGAWGTLKRAAQDADVEVVDDEYHDLFLGVGRGELIPYGSWYLTGFMMDKPLAVLRSDLAELGFERPRRGEGAGGPCRSAARDDGAHRRRAGARDRCAAALLRSPRRDMDAHLLRGSAESRLGALLPAGRAVRRSVS